MTAVEKTTEKMQGIFSSALQKVYEEDQSDSARPNCFNCPLLGLKTELTEPQLMTICSPTCKAAASFCWWWSYQKLQLTTANPEDKLQFFTE